VSNIHENKLIHRNLTPFNLFLSRQNQLIVGPLGIHTIGTLGYFAPEQITGAGYDNKIDMWAIGCILLDLLTLTNSRDTMVSIESRINSIPLQYNSKWAEIIRSLLNSDPNKRPSAQDLCESLLTIKLCISSVSMPNMQRLKRTLPPSVLFILNIFCTPILKRENISNVY